MLIRFALHIVQALLAPRVPPLSEVTTVHRVWPWDCDANLHMNDGRFVSLGGVARVGFMLRIGLAPLFRREGWRPIASAEEVRYFRELLPLARYEIRTRLLTWDEKYFYLEQVFELPGRGPAARILVRTLFRRPSGVIPTAEVLTALGLGGERPEPSEEVRHWIALSELVRRRREG